MRTYSRMVFICSLVLLGWLTLAQATTWYISPSGNNSNNGTSAATPKLTFAHTIALLAAGDTLILLDGTYTSANSGTIAISGLNGTAALPITIRAQNERQAWIQDDGSYAGLYVTGSSYLVFEGLRISSVDNAAAPNWGEPVYAVNNNNLTFRRLLLHNNNRYCNCHLLDLQASTNILVEENELYYFHRHGIGLDHITNSTIRRTYCNSRGHVDLPGGKFSGVTDRGDSCITVYPANDMIIENTISEGNTNLAEVNGSDTNVGNTFLGSISLNELYGVVPNSRGFTLQFMPRDVTLTNFVVISPTNYGVFSRAAVNTRCEHCTVLTPGAGGYISDTNGGFTDGTHSMFLTNSLVANSPGFGVALVSTPIFGLDYVNSYGNGGGNFSPPPPHPNITNELSIDPQMGACRVWIPDASPMKNAGLNNADIGANILYRYENGVLTGVPLWDLTTGAFPCGATAAGLNDTSGNSCINVHLRLNVNTPGCAFPASFGGGGGEPVTLTATPTTVAGGGSVVVAWTNIPTAAADQWIGLYTLGAPVNAYLDWVWMGSCNQNLGTPTPANGECSMTVNQSPGAYEFRAFGDPSGTVLHATSETVTVTGGTVLTKPFLGLRVQ